MPKNTPELSDKPVEGRDFLAVAPNYWGRGSTPKEAVAQLKRLLSRGRTYQVVVLSCAPGAQVDEMGRVVTWPPEGKTWDDFQDDGAEYRRTEKVAELKVRK